MDKNAKAKATPYQTWPVGTELERVKEDSTSTATLWTVAKVEGDVMTMVRSKFLGSLHQAYNGGGNYATERVLLKIRAGTFEAEIISQEILIK